MGKKQKFTCAIALCLMIIGCKESGKQNEVIEDDGWKKETKVSKLVKNVNFIFPENGYAFDNKEDIINKTFDAIEHSSKILGKTDFKDTIYVRVMSSRDEMTIYTGTRAIGNTYPYWNTMYIVANEDVSPPIVHEMMHLVLMLDWDYPKRSSTWMNEGIATFATNDCSGNSVAEIYRYLLATDKLISMEDLSSDFYGQPEMVGYHQSGYVVQYLLEKYTIDHFKKLWTDGFEKFEEIYGAPYPKVKKELEEAIIEKYPKAPKIDWEKFSQGCQ